MKAAVESSGRLPRAIRNDVSRRRIAFVVSAILAAGAFFPGFVGVLTIMPPLPPGCMTTVWGDDARFVKTYFSDFGKKLAYSTFDWATRDKDDPLRIKSTPIPAAVIERFKAM